MRLLIFNSNKLTSTDISDNHIRILEDRFLFAARRREQILEQNPNMTDNEMWAIDLDLLKKKSELEAALDDQRRARRYNDSNSNSSNRNNNSIRS